MDTLALFALLLTLVHAQEYYILQSSFKGGPTFLDNFNFWTSWDPTFGYVHYIDRTAAESFYMINTTNSSVSFGAESTQVLDPNANLGRLSLRLTSIESWTHGLFILDLAHMPDATCGVWPSFWSLGGTETWPMSGHQQRFGYGSFQETAFQTPSLLAFRILIFNIDFCGQWAGPTFNTDGCPALDHSNSWSSCNEFVALNPGAFAETYWEVNYLNVYQLVSGTAAPSSTSLSSVTPAISTSSVSTALSGAQGRSSTPTMSLPAATPFITTGSFTATSSVLSVLSSISASSASASVSSASLAGSSSSTSTASVSSVPSTLTSLASTILPASVLSTSESPLATQVVSEPVGSTSTPAIPASPGPLSCSGSVCTTFTTAVVVQTVTVVMDRERLLRKKQIRAVRSPGEFGDEPNTLT